MNENPDPKLRGLLREWQANPAPAPEFKAAVWQRIAKGEEHAALNKWSFVRDWLFVQLPQPAYAVALLAVTAITSVAIANARAERAREQYRVNAARQYLASIDPISMSADGSRAVR